MNRQDYLARLQAAIQQWHNCGAVYRMTIPVHEVVGGETVWKGEVEVFNLTGHPKAKRAYAWSQRDGANDEDLVTMLEIAPVVSPITAVRAAIMARTKKGEK